MKKLEMSRTALGLSALVSLFWLTPLGCADRPQLVNGACETLLSGKCGGACKATEDCESGLHCGPDKTCTASCTASSASDFCKSGERCSSDGRCVSDPGFNFGGAGGQSGSGGSGNGECIDVKVDFAPQIPTVMLLIDQSGSMNEDNFGQSVKDAVTAGTYDIWNCGDGPDGDSEDDEYWRWNVVRNVLLNPTTGVVKPLETKVRFGMALYTSDNGWMNPDTDMKDPSKECPTLEKVPLGFSRHQDMLDTFVCSDIRGDTPTGESLTAVAAELKAYTEPGPKLIVVATDGEPDSCDCPNFGSNEAPACRDSAFNSPNKPSELVKADVVARAKSIFEDDNIVVHVINVSRPDNATLKAHLQEVAEAGGGQLFDGFNPGAIKTAFNSIIDGARSCKIDLDGEISPGKETTGKITLDGKALGYGDANGWKRNTPSQIELVGTACSTIKSGEHDLKITFPCGTFIPPITK